MNIFLKFLSKILFFVVVMFFYTNVLYADRGNIEQLEPAALPNQNFPGYFDTNMPPERRFMFSLPLGELTFGGTKNFSASVNLPLIFYMMDTWNPGILLSLRYRFFSDENLSSTITGYGGYFRYKKTDDRFKIYYLNGTYNNLITINKNNFITTQVNGLKLKYKTWESDETDADTKSLNSITLSIGHIYILNKKWIMHNLVGAPVLFNFYEENNMFNGTGTFKHITNFPFFYRIIFDWSVTPNSLLTFGGFLLVQSELPFLILPWINWSVLF